MSQFISISGYFVPTASPYSGNYVKNLPPTVNQQGLTMHQQLFRDAPTPQGHHPTYCTFLANNGANFPAHFASDNARDAGTSEAEAGDGTMDETQDESEFYQIYFRIFRNSYLKRIYFRSKSIQYPISIRHNLCNISQSNVFSK